MKPTPTSAFLAIMATLAYLAVAVLGWGGFAAFFSHPARIFLAIALFVMAAVYAIYGAAIPLGDRRVEIEVAIFLVALIWDLFTSGREITGADSPAFPRAARVLSYLGYLVVVSTIALFISTQTLASSGESLPKLVESEDVVRQGLVWLGAPLLLLRTALRWAESVRRGQLPD